MLAAHLGQRQGDILRLSRSVYRDGVFHITQNKTGRYVPVPATPGLRDRLAKGPASASTFVLNENTGQPYVADTFRHDFLTTKRKAAKACPALTGVWYMDLRRTCVVWLAEEGTELYDIAAVTGHEIETCTRIVETYLPRTARMAARAIGNLSQRRDRRAREQPNGNEKA